MLAEDESRGYAIVEDRAAVLQKGSTPQARLGSLISLVGEGENRRIALAVPGYRASASEAPVGRIQFLDPTSMTVVRVIENPEACKCRFGSGIQLVAQGVVSEPRLVVTSAAEVTCPEFGHVFAFDDAGTLDWSITGKDLDLRISGQLAVVKTGPTAGSPRAVVAGVGRSFSAELVAVDLDLQQVLWQVRAPGDRSSDAGAIVLAIQDVDGDGVADLLVTNPSATHAGKVYAGMASALSSTTGRVLWSAWGQDADSGFGNAAIPLPGNGADGGIILVSAPGNLPPSTGGWFYALDALTGKSRWSVGAPEGLSDPVVSMQAIHGSGESTGFHGVAVAYEVESGLSRLFLVEVVALSQAIHWTKVDGVVAWHSSAPSGILALLDSNGANGDSGAVVDLLTGHPTASVDGMAGAGIVYRCRIERQR